MPVQPSKLLCHVGSYAAVLLETAAACMATPVNCQWTAQDGADPSHATVLLSVLHWNTAMDVKARNAGARAKTAHRKLQIPDGFKILWTTPRINNLDWQRGCKVWSAGSVDVGVLVHVFMPSVFIASVNKLHHPFVKWPKTLDIQS